MSHPVPRWSILCFLARRTQLRFTEGVLRGGAQRQPQNMVWRNTPSKKSGLRSLLENFPKLSENIALVITRCLKDLAWGREPFSRNLRIEGEALFCGTYGLGPKESEVEIRGFVGKICRSKQKWGKELAELEDGYYRCRMELTRELIHLKNLIEHGTPLLGKCGLCPILKIKPSSMGRR